MVAKRSSLVRFSEEGIPGNVVRVWTDTAGGSSRRIGPGLGVIYPRTLAYMAEKRV